MAMVISSTQFLWGEDRFDTTKVYGGMNIVRHNVGPWQLVESHNCGMII